MANRTELRKKCMTILYQMEVYDKNQIKYDVEDVIKEVLDLDNEFVKEIVYGVVTYKNVLDSMANKYLKGWTIDRLGNTDIAILRMGIFELLYTDTPPVVVINEAVELAKAYSDDSVRKMINGVLDKIYLEKEEKDAK
ncbi:MAG: transcription antitermination factor NusB [Bacilli bacterium]|nr:transcription antitermination factor NusB [Bacilli bacterium]